MSDDSKDFKSMVLAATSLIASIVGSSGAVISLFGDEVHMWSFWGFIAVLMVGFFSSIKWKKTVQDIIKKADWLVAVFAISSLILVIFFLFYNFREHIFFSDISHYGSTGDFLGGTLGTFFSFLTLLYLIKQNVDIEKREKERSDGELKRDQLVRYDLISKQLYRDFDVIESRFLSIKVGNATGVEAIKILHTNLTSNKENLSTEMSGKLESFCSILYYQLKRVFRGMLEEEYGSENFLMYAKHHDLIRNLIGRDIVEKIHDLLKSFESNNEGVAFIIHYTEVMKNRGRSAEIYDRFMIEDLQNFNFFSHS